MPNWVYNTMRVDGKLRDLQHFYEVITAPPMREVEGGYEPTPLGDNEFSYWNIKHPEDLDAYFTTSGYSPDPEKMATFNNGPTNWYNWNIANWGCKWDACESSVTLERGNGHSWIDMRWESPWSPPIEWVTHCAKEYPELEFSFDYQEEEGWGGTMEFYNGELTEATDYDIPDSHADYTERELECVCSWEEDESCWYDDCPRPELSE
jgi:hypothetical protein